MEKEEILKKIKEEWESDYFFELGIYQHLVGCKQKFEMVKNHVVSTFSKEELKFELDKELADLKILLDLYVKDDMINQRLNKFSKNIDRDKNDNINS